MNLSVGLFLDEIESDNRVQIGRIRRNIRDSSNPFELPDSKFMCYFRINKDAMHYLLNAMTPFFKKSTHTSSISPLLKICAALRFMGTGSYQACSGNDFNIGLAQPTFSVVLDEVLNIFDNKMGKQWIKAAMTDTEMNESKLAVYEHSGFPGVIGFVDGTHIRISSPRTEEQHLYLNRKGYHSINAMIYCDFKLRIRYVDGRYPGANHDSHVWNLSSLKEYLDRNLPPNTWILGDSGYPLQRNLITPFRSTTEGSEQAQFNKVHCKARNTVERTIGVLKSKFRCLLSVRGLHYSSAKATKVINACCIMHNICKHFNVVEDMLELHELQQSTVEEDVHHSSIEAEHIRINIMRSVIS